MHQWDVILYVEDDDAYAQIVQYALKQGGFKHKFVHVNSAARAQAYLSGTGEFNDRERYPLPSVILADLKMPEFTGLDLLQWLRTQSAHRLLPFVVLTSSDDLKDVGQAYRLGANSFLMKPPQVPDLVEMLKAFDTLWIKYNVTAG